MTSKLREYLKTVQEQQVLRKDGLFIIEVQTSFSFCVVIRCIIDGIRQNKGFEFFEDDDERNKEKIKEIKTIIRNQKAK